MNMYSRFLFRSSPGSSLRLGQAPAFWWRQGLATITIPSAPGPCGHFSRTPLQAPLVRKLVAGPPPAPQVLVLSRGPVEVLPGLVDLVGDQVREAHARRVQGRATQELPPELAGTGSTHLPRLGQQEHAPSSLLDHLRDLEHKGPLLQGHIIDAALKDPPALCEEVADGLQAPVLEVRECRAIQVLQPAQGGEPVRGRFVGRQSSRFCRCASR